MPTWRSRPLVVIAFATALVTVTFVTPLATLPRTAADLGGGAGSQAWVLSAMSVGLAAGLLGAGDVGDVRGRRRVFVIGLIALTLGALACALAPEVGWFIAGRAVQGLGGAAVLACGLALLAHEYNTPAARAYATGIWGAGVGAGIAAGSLLAGGLDVGTGWRETYGLVGVAGAGLVVLTLQWVPESRSSALRRVDVAGGLLLAGAMTAAVGALTEARSGLSMTVILLSAVTLLLITGFAWQEVRVASPLLELRLLTDHRFVAATLGSLVLGAGMIGMAAYLPTMVQRGLGGSVWTGSVLVAIWAGVGVVSSSGIRHVPRPLSGPAPLAALLAALAVAQILALGVSSTSSPWRLAPALALAGVATGALNALLGRESVASVAADRAAMGSGANNAARYLGAAVGITVFAVISAHGGVGAAGVVHGWNVAVTVAGTLTLVGAAGIALLAMRVQTPRAIHVRVR